MNQIKLQAKGLVKQILPYGITFIGAAVLIVAVRLDLTPKWEAIKFAYTDPQAVMWVKSNLEARQYNVRRQLQEELNPEKPATGSVSFYLSPK